MSDAEFRRRCSELLTAVKKRDRENQLAIGRMVVLANQRWDKKTYDAFVEDCAKALDHHPSTLWRWRRHAEREMGVPPEAPARGVRGTRAPRVDREVIEAKSEDAISSPPLPVAAERGQGDGVGYPPAPPSPAAPSPEVVEQSGGDGGPSSPPPATPTSATSGRSRPVGAPGRSAGPAPRPAEPFNVRPPRTVDELDALLAAVGGTPPALFLNKNHFNWSLAWKRMSEEDRRMAALNGAHRDVQPYPKVGKR
ncbi:MAG: hypothetical protein ACRD2W_02145 [Acidimicrobiales bacterium]